jgi:hypothetical protein
MPASSDSLLSRRSVWLAFAGATLAAVACIVGLIGRPTPPAPPPLEAPSVSIESGPSRWLWRERRQEALAVDSERSSATSLDLSRTSCAPDDALYAAALDGTCYLRHQALVALVTQRRFDGAPRRFDSSDFAALLQPSRVAGESSSAAATTLRERAARARAATYVDEREASYCSFVLEGATPRLQLVAQCALDRLDLYIGTPPRVERAVSCGINQVSSCSDACSTDSDCRPSDPDDDCGCAQSRCVRGQCTACPPRRVCGDPTFTTRAAPWVFRAPITREQESLARALAARPAAFRAILHFAVTAASRDVRPRADGTIEFDSGYRLQVRPLAFAVALCGDRCRAATRAVLPLFSVPRWQSEVGGLRTRCERGLCRSELTGSSRGLEEPSAPLDE